MFWTGGTVDLGFGFSALFLLGGFGVVVVVVVGGSVVVCFLKAVVVVDGVVLGGNGGEIGGGGNSRFISNSRVPTASKDDLFL